MSAVTALPHGRPLTRRDLDAMPDDGHRYELIDGVLVVTPAPSWHHQRAVTRLIRLLDDACPPDLEVLAAPFDVTLADDTVVLPDVLVARRSELTMRELPAAPVLAVEVLSPSTRRFDLTLKRARFEAAGTANYWVVDPLEVTLTAWELRAGSYTVATVVHAGTAWETIAPYPMSIDPARLVSEY